jgi:hypothetical protein
LPAAASIDVNRFFPAIGAAPTMAPFAATNPHAVDKDKTATDFIKERQELNKAMGVSDTPQAELEKSLRDKKANEPEEKNRIVGENIVGLGALIAGAGGKNPIQNIALSSSQALKQYQSDMDKFRKAQDEREKALNEIAVANNEIKLGYVKDGMLRRDAAQKNFRDSELKITEIGTHYAGVQGQVAAHNFATINTAETARGSAAVQAELSRQQIAAQIQIARANIAARGDRVPSEIQLLEWAQSSPRNMATLMSVQAAKHPATGPEAVLKSLGGGNVPPRPANAVQPSK